MASIGTRKSHPRVRVLLNLVLPLFRTVATLKHGCATFKIGSCNFLMPCF